MGGRLLGRHHICIPHELTKIFSFQQNLQVLLQNICIYLHTQRIPLNVLMMRVEGASVAFACVQHCNNTRALSVHYSANNGDNGNTTQHFNCSTKAWKWIRTYAYMYLCMYIQHLTMYTYNCKGSRLHISMYIYPMYMYANAFMYLYVYIFTSSIQCVYICTILYI